MGAAWALSLRNAKGVEVGEEKCERQWWWTWTWGQWCHVCQENAPGFLRFGCLRSKMEKRIQFMLEEKKGK